MKATTVTMDINKLNKLLEKYDVKYFKAEELGKHYNAKWKGANFILPPESMWQRILPTLALADAIREDLGRPITVISGFRDPEYNRIIGGATNSQHKEFRALDLQVNADHHLDLISVAAKKVQEFRNRGIEVGFGIYPTFIHIDTNFKSRFWT